MSKNKDNFPPDAKSYEITDAIGFGASSRVVKAKCLTNGENVAIKIVSLLDIDLEDTRREIQVMALCNHPNLVTNYCSFVSNKELWIVMPLCGGGSVLDIMKYAHPKGLSEILIATILHYILKGIEYLHSTGRIHRDIKAGNILVDSDGRVQLADFGVSAWLMEKGKARNNRTTFVGTPCWMAPEVMAQSKGYDYSADIWSFGITCIELAIGQAPLAHLPPMEVLLYTMQNDPPTLPENDCSGKKFSKAFRDFLSQCLQKTPSKRSTASKLLEHKFFKQVKKYDYIAQTLLHNLPGLTQRAKQINQKHTKRMKQVFQFEQSSSKLNKQGAQKKTNQNSQQLNSNASSNSQSGGFNWVGEIFSQIANDSSTSKQSNNNDQENNQSKNSIGRGGISSSSNQTTSNHQKNNNNQNLSTSASNNIVANKHQKNDKLNASSPSPLIDLSDIQNSNVQQANNNNNSNQSSPSSSSDTQLLQLIYSQQQEQTKILQSLQQKSLQPVQQTSSNPLTSNPLSTIELLTRQIQQLAYELSSAKETIVNLKKENIKLKQQIKK